MSDSNQPPPPPPWSSSASGQPTYNPAISQGAPPPPPPPVTYGAPGQQATPYGYPGAAPYSPGYGAVQTKNDGFAIAALVCAIVGFFTCGITAVLGVIFGFVSRARIKKSNGSLLGGGMALAGIIVGFVFVAFWGIYWIGALITRSSRLGAAFA
jgi:Domain of unknown function (DUF4190)